MAGERTANIRQAPALATMEAWPSTARSDTVTVKCCRERNSANLDWYDRNEPSSETAGRRKNLQPSDRANAAPRRTLNAGEYFTSGTKNAKRHHQKKHRSVGDEVTPLIMDCIVIRMPQPHQTNARDVDGNNGQTCEARPKEICARPPMPNPLRDADPAKKG